jgi:hypothetical protein
VYICGAMLIHELHALLHGVTVVYRGKINMKLHTVTAIKQSVEGGNYIVDVQCIDSKNNKKYAKLAYRTTTKDGQLRIRCEVLIQGNSSLKGSLAPDPSWHEITTFIIKKINIVHLIQVVDEEGAKKLFASLVAGFLYDEIMEVFGSFTTLNHAIAYNMPQIFMMLPVIE